MRNIFHVYINIFIYCIQASEFEEVEVHADDTDIAMMLVHHWKDNLHEIIFCGTQSRKCWSIREASQSLSQKIKDIILFIHAFSGCDTTSALYGVGKTSMLKKFEGII